MMSLFMKMFEQTLNILSTMCQILVTLLTIFTELVKAKEQAKPVSKTFRVKGPTPKSNVSELAKKFEQRSSALAETIQECDDMNRKTAKHNERMTNVIRDWQGKFAIMLQNFTCPLTGNSLKDPVVLAQTGHTFEKGAIVTHLQTHDTCPVTNQTLLSKELTPNHALKAAMDVWDEIMSAETE